MKNSNISQHLARRDGELEVVSSEAGELDAELLKSLGDLKTELGNLPDVELPELFRFRREVLGETLTVGLSRPIMRDVD